MEDCLGIPQQEYSEFSSRLHTRVGNQHIPLLGSLELTFRCNLRCQHCYVPIEQRANRRGKELSLPETKRILDEITEAGCLWLLLTGGEPLLRPDFKDIYLYAKRKGLLLTLFSNGTLVTPRIADFLAEWRPFKIEFTLYGATQETYERVTGIPGSYAKCRRGIDLLLERNLPLSLKTMVMTLNYHELDGMQSLADSLGVSFRFDPIVHAALNGSSIPADFRLSPQEVVNLEKSDQDRSNRWPKYIQDNLNNKIQGRNLYLCKAGQKSFHIGPTGQLSMCISARNPSYNLLEGGFKEGWDYFLPKVTSQLYDDRFPCTDCQLRRICVQCPALSELESGDPEARVEYLCQVTKLRYKSFATEM